MFVLHFTFPIKPSALINLQDLVENMLFYFAIQKEFSNKNVFVEKKVRIKFHYMFKRNAKSIRKNSAYKMQYIHLNILSL